jgi:hypothetical protein
MGSITCLDAEPVTGSSGGVRHLMVSDPYRNEIAVAGPLDAS